MQTPHTGPTNRPTALAHASLTLPRGGWIYGAFMLCWLHGGRADPTLPVSTNAGETNFSLTSPTLHPGVDVGAATGTYSTDGHSLTIHQTTATTILDWNSFNIAAGNTVQFVQPATTSVALNDIHQLDASQIFGNLSANGQVYLVNSNGFVFGPTASVNLNSLVATNLAITDAVFAQGITNVVSNGTTTSSISSTSTPVAAFSGDGTVYRNTSSGVEKISVLVEKGAVINAADTGRVILAAPEVVNDGKITAPDGQVILVAATDKVYLQESTSADLRGLLVEVNTGGDVKNIGTILTERGNTTMMGFAVSQQGIVSASTSVSLNGSIRLLANEGATLVTQNSVSVLEPATTQRSRVSGDGLGTQATVTLASSSLTTVTLDTSAGTASSAAAQPQSIVDVEGGTIDMQAGSSIVAHGGAVDMVATIAPTLSNLDFPQSSLPGQYSTSSSNPSRILLETGSSIDVSGAADVQMSMASNILNLTLYSYELRNDPTQKTGLLYGQSVSVDTRSGTALADVSEAKAAQTFSVGYRNSNAGSVNLLSEGDAIVQKGAEINISGGSVDYQGGFIPLTMLESNGMVYTLATASPSLTYQKILNNSYYESGYVQGMNAGTVNIASRDVVLDGSILAHTTAGLLQRTVDSLPTGGQLNIDTTQLSNTTQQEVIFQATQTDTTLPATGGVQTPLYLSPALFSQGLNNLSLKTGGNLSIAKNADMAVAGLGSITLRAGSMDIQGSITAPAGNISLSTGTNITSNTTSGDIQLAAGSVLDSSGQWINDFTDLVAGNNLKPLDINAGNISLNAQGNLLLASGSSLIANGGGGLNSSFKLSGGDGGNISLTTASATEVNTIMELGASLSAYAISKDGGLSITANAIDIANSVSGLPTNTDTLYIPASLLNSGGFSSYSLTANAGNLTIAANAQLVLQQNNWQLSGNAYAAISGSNMAGLTSLWQLTENLRTPVDLSLNLAQNAGIGGYAADRSITMATGASISTDPKAVVSFNSDANIYVDGAINAAGGVINLTVADSDPSYNPNQAIALGANAVLDVSATTVYTPSPAGFILGGILAGGTVNITANRGYILTDNSSVINVSGGNAQLDIANASGYSLQNVASAAGSINLTAAEGMVLQGGLLGKAGVGETAAGSGSTAAAGTLDIILNPQNTNQNTTAGTDSPFPTGSRNIIVSSQPVDLLSSSQISSGSVPTRLNGLAYISSAQITNGDFGSLKLASLVLAGDLSSLGIADTGSIIFNGDINMTLNQSLILDAPMISHEWNSSSDTGQVTLMTDLFTLGSSLNQSGIGTLSNPSVDLSSSGASATLTVSADNIELLGGVMLDAFSKVSLISNSGDINMVGVINPYATVQQMIGGLQMAGELDLTATDIYPATLSQYTIQINSSLTPNGLVKILPATGTEYTPLSAAGQLSIISPNIISHGNLLAPFGSINLDASTALTLASGSLTSVSDSSGVTIPFGNTTGSGAYWEYTIGTNINLITATPEKSITLTSPAINLNSGSVVNLNGGGDLQAYELVQAAGGSIAYLSSSYQQSYAVIPAYEAKYAPYDYLEFPGSGVSLGETVTLSAGADGLAAGQYVLLPSYYALLPGAYLITPEAAVGNLGAGETLTLADGVAVVAGYTGVAGSTVSSSLLTGFAVQQGSVALSYSPYQLTTASSFFAANTSSGSVASLPADGGNLSLAAAQTLNLDGSIYATPSSGGLGGQLDISGNSFNIGSQANSGSALFVDAASLNALAASSSNKYQGVDSILIGGTRSRSSSGVALTVTAANIDVSAGTSLSAPEIILAASNNITVESGASITASGTLSHSDTVLTISNANSSYADGALLRVSDAAQATVTRSNLAGTSGTLDLATASSLTATGSILIDASQTGSLLGNIVMPNGALTLSGSLITLGGTANAAAGFQLSDATLNQLHVGSLELNSYSTVDIASAINLQLSSLTIDSAGIYGATTSGQNASITATSGITLQNTGHYASTATTSGAGNLTLKAATITLGSGNYAINGFNQVNLNATGSLVDSGTSSISVGGALNINTPIWTASAGADTTLNLGAYDLALSSASGTTASTALGAMLNVTAGDIADQGYIDMASGTVNLTAAQNLTLSSAASIVTSGQSVTLGKNVEYSAGGQINLTSTLGNFDIQQGASLNISGTSLGGNAGSITLNAENTGTGVGNINLDGTIAGQAYHNGTGGSFTLAANSFNVNADTSLSKLNTLLQSGGFNNDLSVHLLGAGNLLVAATDKVEAANVTLTADNGIVEVAGGIAVSAATAGEIQLSANNGVQVDAGAVLNAVSTGADKTGGSITLTSEPLLNQGTGVTISSGATLNVAGGSGGLGGTVEVVVNQLNGNNAPVHIAANTINGAASMVVDAMSHYQNIGLSNAGILAMYDSNQQYLSAAAANSDLQGRLGGFSLQPGLDIVSSGSLTLNLSDSVTGSGWQQATSSNTWYINLADVAGMISSLSENGVALTEVNYSYLTTKGTWYFDDNPQSATFRDLFVYLNPVSGVYNPNTLSEKSTFTLLESNGWDLALPYTASQTATTGLLSLRAAGNLNIDQTLSDGFSIASNTQLLLNSGSSWSYLLVAGANLDSANPEDVQAAVSAGNLTIGTNTSVRTGTGNIDAAAAGNISLTDWTSTLYTAGQSSVTDPYLSDRPLFAVAYPTDGGNVVLKAGGNIVGATTSQLMSDWLQRIGIWSSGTISTTNLPLAWGIDFGYVIPTTIQGSTSAIVNDSLGFRENIGALGGGNVSISAGQSVENLSVMLPTTAITTVESGSSVITEQGGGNLNVSAGGNIAGGVFYDEKGVATLSAGNAITGGSQYTAGPVLGMGDSQFAVSAADGITIDTVLNPFILTEAKFFYTSGNAYFTTYTANSSLSLQSLSGDINLSNNASVLEQLYSVYSYTNNKLVANSNKPLNASAALLSLYPGAVEVSALSGGLNINSSMYLSPAANTSFDLLAENSVTLAGSVLFNQLDVSPSVYLSVSQPMTSANTTYLGTTVSGGNIATLHAATPVHANDTSVNQIVAATGSVIGLSSSSSSGATINAAKATDVSAAGDFSNLSLLIQNLNSAYQDVSTISVGGDIVFPTTRNAVTGAFQGYGQIIVSGPGWLNLWAGGSINLGISSGVVSKGNELNPALPATGADITVLAGDRIDQNTAGLSSYLQNYVTSSSYQNGLDAQLATALQNPASIGNSQLVANLQSLITAINAARTGMAASGDTSALLQLALPILFDQLNLAAVDVNTAVGNVAYNIGYDAIKLLFPSVAAGNITLDFSEIQTLQGGNINLLAPGGALNVGLAASDLSTGKTAAELGVVVQGSGNANVLTKNNVEVNQSRIFALEAGDITIWSSYGDIDAGRGAKSSQGSQSPIGTYDANGNLILEYPPTVSGSGIRTQSAYGSVASGNITLLAPQGVVNANEAGIAGRNINIAAQQVIGAANIQASGTTLGVPSTQTVIAVPDSSATATAAVSKASDLDQLENETSNARKQNKAVDVVLLSTQLVGFGNCSLSDVKVGRKGCGM